MQSTLLPGHGPAAAVRCASPTPSGQGASRRATTGTTTAASRAPDAAMSSRPALPSKPLSRLNRALTNSRIPAKATQVPSLHRRHGTVWWRGLVLHGIHEMQHRRSSQSVLAHECCAAACALGGPARGYRGPMALSAAPRGPSWPAGQWIASEPWDGTLLDRCPHRQPRHGGRSADRHPGVSSAGCGAAQLARAAEQAQRRQRTTVTSAAGAHRAGAPIVALTSRSCDGGRGLR